MAYLIPCPCDMDLVSLFELYRSVPGMEVTLGTVRKSDEKKVDVRSITKNEAMTDGPNG